MSTVFVAGTCDTKGAELHYARDCLGAVGLEARIVDLDTSGAPREPADIDAATVAAHPRTALLFYPSTTAARRWLQWRWRSSDMCWPA